MPGSCLECPPSKEFGVFGLADISVNRRESEPVIPSLGLHLGCSQESLDRFIGPTLLVKSEAKVVPRSGKSRIDRARFFEGKNGPIEVARFRARASPRR